MWAQYGETILVEYKSEHFSLCETHLVNIYQEPNHALLLEP